MLVRIQSEQNSRLLLAMQENSPNTEKTVWQFLTKSNIPLPHVIAIPLRFLYSREMKTCSQIVSPSFLSPYPPPTPRAICFWNSFSPISVPLTSACTNIVHPEILVSWDSPQCGPCPELIRRADLYEPNSQETGWSVRMPACPSAMRNLISNHSVRFSPVVRTTIALGNKIPWTDRGFIGRWGNAENHEQVEYFGCAGKC